MDKVYIIILNWNGWIDTLECLESIFSNDYSNYQVIVCDNDSKDESLDKVKAWADGRLLAINPEVSPTRGLVHPIVKPIRYVEYNRSNAEAGGRVEDRDVPLIIIHSDANLGFAGGNNICLRYILSRDDFKYVWLLNNDTVINSDALSSMVKRMHEKPSAGMCGSTLLYYHAPGVVQALGGATYSPWLATSKHIGAFQKLNESIDIVDVEARMKYIVGASLLVSRPFLCDVGLMSEEYFLYFEEIDWSTRMGNKYSLAYAAKSIVYHKEGSSIGSNSNPKRKSIKADYYSIRNRLIFTRNFYPFALPTVYLGILVAIVNRIRRGQWERVFMIIDILIKE
jgi:GT2 family glycosyltransferase